MQALEKIGILEQDEDKGGRRITQAGQRDLDREFFPFSIQVSCEFRASIRLVRRDLRRWHMIWTWAYILIMIS